MGEIPEILACINFGEWRWHDDGADLVTKLHNAVVRHHRKCDGNCDATKAVEMVRTQGRLVGKPRHQIRAATG